MLRTGVALAGTSARLIVVAHQVFKLNAQRLGNPLERVHRNVLAPAFHVADIGWGQLRFFRKLLLCHPAKFAIKPNPLTEDLAMARNGWHGANRNRNHPNQP